MLNYLPCENKTDKKCKQSHSLQTKRVKCIMLSLEFLYDCSSYCLLSWPAVEKGWDKEILEFRRVDESDEVEHGDDDGDKERKVHHLHES